MTDVTRSFNPYIDAVVDSGPIVRTVWTYSFALTPEQVGMGNNSQAFLSMSEERKADFRYALAQFSMVCNLSFTEIPATVDSDLITAYDLSGPWSGMTQGNAWGSYIFYNTGEPNPRPGTYAFHNYLHELGHALGLRHPADPSAGLKGLMPADHRGMNYAVDYSSSHVVGGFTYGDSIFQSLGMDDIRAIQYRYGANYTTNNGDTVYSWDPTTGAEYIKEGAGVAVKQNNPASPITFLAIWDGGGTDTYDLSNFTKNQNIDLRPGNWSTISPDLLPVPMSQNAIVPGNVGNAYLAYDPVSGLADLRSLIENALGGSGNDVITGNQANNLLNGNAGDDALYGLTGDDTLIGGSGNDTLDGGPGADSLVGGTGDDTYYIDDARDVVVEAANEGVDTIITTVNVSLRDTGYANIESLTANGSQVLVEGNDLANTLIGNAQANLLKGYGGADKLYGGDGADTLDGGDGDDVLNGESGADSLLGGAGNDTLDGGAGNDTLRGGDGNDVYLFGFGSGQDTIIQGDGGSDTLKLGPGVGPADIIWSRQGDNLVGVLRGDADQVTIIDWYRSNTNTLNVTLYDGTPLPVTIAQWGGAGADTMTGGDQNDRLQGLDGDDKLTGGAGNDILDGGAGADTMVGGLGDDIFIVDDAKDSVVENPGEGNDTIISSIAYSLNGTNIENLTLTGVANINATGSSSNNILIGNDGNNVLDGLGGADTLIGGKGDDTYYLDGLTDVVIEKSGEGNDTVIVSISGYTLGANIENLKLSSTLSTTGNIANGNDGANAITGNDYANMLYGYGGADTIDGGAGNDTIYGGDGNDLINGGTGNDFLRGDLGDDTLIGGAGDDDLWGGLGNNVYYFGKGDGSDTISSWNANADKLIFKSDVSINDISWSRVPNSTDLAINLSDGSKVILYSWFVGRPITIYLNDGTQLMPFVPTKGTTGDDSLSGSTGNDTLDGGVGADTMSGGTGNDTYYVDDINDVVNEDASAGTDSVVSSIADYTLPSNVENVQLSTNAVNGTGNDLNNKIIGNDQANKLTGLGGNDTIDGGAGADTMIGGLGDDTYYVDNAGDVVIESSGDGTGADTIIVNGVDYSLANVANVENLTLNGSQIRVTGNSADNKLVGNDANNIIDGGAGIDMLTGGKGDDVYYVDSRDDRIIENRDEGYDTVYASVDYTIENTQVEKLILTGTVVYGKGNDLANVIIGNGANNIIDGGAGADTMTGGAGDDLYYVENAGDVVQEDANGGTDTVALWLDGYVLPTNVENVILVGDIVFEGEPQAPLKAYGNELNNLMTGNGHDNIFYGYAGNDTLDGGYGADSLYGGTGDDVYIVDNLNDLVVENAGEGLDAVRTTLSAYRLGANVENLVFIGKGEFTGVGNEAANVITGGDGADDLAGGAGADTLNGGASADRLKGEDGDDVLNGAGGNDTLSGGAGADTLNGGAGDDLMQGGAGDDVYYVDQMGDVVVEASGEGTDLVISSLLEYTLADNVENLTLAATVAVKGYGNALNNVITGNSLANQLYGLGGDDSLLGGDGNDTLDGGEGYDTLLGGAGNDVLYGGAGDDVLTGGAGADTIYGGLGNDVYIFNRGDGADVVYDDYGSLNAQNAGADTLSFGAGITSAQITLTISGADLVVSVADPNTSTITDKITLKNWFSTNSRVETFRFADGTTLSQRDLIERVPGAGNDVFTWTDTPVTLTLGLGADNVTTGAFADKLDGGAGNDTLNSGAGDDTLIGGVGSDTLYGGLGNDIYVFNRGDGADVVYDDYGALSAQNAGADVLAFGDGITADQLLFALSGADLVISVKDPNSTGTPTDKITLKNWTDTLRRVETISFSDGTTLNARQMMERLPTTGNDTLTWTETAINWAGGAGADKLTSGAFNDTLTGGAGNDTLDGGAGYDIAVFSGAKAEYTITKLSNGSYTVADKTSTRDGTDTLTNIEALRFTDGLFNIADLAPVANSTPTILSPANVTVVENVAPSKVILQVVGFDPDPGAVLTYGIIGGADSSAFSIDARTGELRFNASPDYERPTDAGGDNTYDVTVEVSDGARKVTQTITVTVTNAIESAPLIASPGDVTVNENVAPTTSIYKVAGSDPQGAALTYALSGGADKGLFAIDATTGDLRFLNAPDYENPSDANRDRVYDVEVSVSNGVFTTKKSLSISLADIDEAPVISSPTSVNVAENVAPAATILRIVAVDPEGRKLSYALSGGADKDLFSIDGNGNVSFKASPDFEARADANGDNVYQIEVQVSDGTQVTTQSVSITLADVNEAPTITSPTNVFLNANDVTIATPVYTVKGRDPDANASFVYSIVDGLDKALFNIDSSTGVVTFKTAPSFSAPTDWGRDNVYDIKVRLSDTKISVDQSISITLTNGVQSPPALTSAKSVTVAENVAITTPIYKVTGTDADPGTTLTYAIVGGLDKARFVIDGVTGEVRFISSPDFEKPGDNGADNAYDLIVQVSDGGLVSQQSISIIVTDVNDVAPVITSASAVQVRENIAITTPIYRVTSTDVDTVGATTYAIVGGADKDLFIIDPITGEITFRSAPDYERPSDQGGDHVYNLTISANDGVQSSTKDILITLTDVAEKTAPKSDFNGDGRSDILLQHSGGGVFSWAMNGKALADYGSIGWMPGADWQVKGTGDFNADGHHDVLLQNVKDGACYVWEVDGKSLIDYGSIGWTPGADWQAKGTGDFNGDGYSDVLLQNAKDGSCYVWELNGKSLIDSGSIGWIPGKDWQVRGTGDFNGDGKSDVLLQNVNDGFCYVWELNGKSLVDSGSVGWVPGKDWQVKGTGDFNGDGKSDILLQNANDGACYLWELNGKTLVDYGSIGWVPGKDWQVKGTGDYDGDGRSDVLLQNVNDGACYLWDLNGKSLVDYGTVGWTPGPDWIVKG